MQIQNIFITLYGETNRFLVRAAWLWTQSVIYFCYAFCYRCRMAETYIIMQNKFTLFSPPDSPAKLTCFIDKIFYIKDIFQKIFLNYEIRVIHVYWSICFKKLNVKWLKRKRFIIASLTKCCCIMCYLGYVPTLLFWTGMSRFERTTPALMFTSVLSPVLRWSWLECQILISISSRSHFLQTGYENLGY